jgi:crotonobetainyl-CoA:carnitine CoA-transferase CaiB-like acyl-CoA transferase
MTDSPMRVLDFSRLLPGPYCSRILTDFGFEVVRVEQPGGSDWSRYVPPLDPESGESLIFRALNRGKKSLGLNLKSEKGRDIVLQLIETSDVLLESFRPGVMERLGLGYERLAQANPCLIYCALSGYGPDGPYRERAGHDLNYQGLPSSTWPGHSGQQSASCWHSWIESEPGGGSAWKAPCWGEPFRSCRCRWPGTQGGTRWQGAPMS